MAQRAGYKRYDELAAWDLDASCRRWINQDSPANRRLKKKLRRQARKKLNRVVGNKKGEIMMDDFELYDGEDLDSEDLPVDEWELDEWEAMYEGEDDYPEDDYYEDWDNLERGFDPYMGCYSDDC